MSTKLKKQKILKCQFCDVTSHSSPGLKCHITKKIKIPSWTTPWQNLTTETAMDLSLLIVSLMKWLILLIVLKKKCETEVEKYKKKCEYSNYCPALTKLALDLHVKKSLSVCLFVCLSTLFFKASNWMIYWLLTVVLAPYLSD